MPLYEYRCETHGCFDERRPFAECNAPMACPQCGAACERVFTAPRLRGLATSTRIAHERNEKSRHQPHVCTSGCSHGAVKKRSEPQLTDYRGARPWVIEHG